MTEGASVAVIDDDPQIRNSLKVLLSTASIATETFESAEDFLSSPACGNVGCLLLDVRLPGMTGMDLLKALPTGRRGCPVIVITGHGDVPLAVRAMRMGAFHFVQKPFDPETLLAICLEALERAERGADERQRIQKLESMYESLTERERQVLELLVDGLPSKLIAHELGISTRTAEHHRSAVMKKMKARSTSHLVRMALDMQRGDSRNVGP